MSADARKLATFLSDEGIELVSVLRLLPSDALILRYPGELGRGAICRLGERLEHWAEATLGHRVQCLVLENGVSIEVLRNGAMDAPTPMMQRAEQEGIR